METESNQILWKSKSNGHKSLVLLLICLVLAALVIASAFIITSNDSVSENASIIVLVISMLIIIFCIVMVCLVRLTDLKWNVSNLLFGLAESGLYFTGVARQDSYFYAEWSEMSGYSLAKNKKGKVTVTVYFNGVANAGSYGKIKYLKMVNITGVDEMCKVFEKFGIGQMELTKNTEN